jgi:negative regulator of replication initiation
MNAIENEGTVAPRQVMVRLPEMCAVALEDEAKERGTTLAAFCREVLTDHVKNAGTRNEIKQIVKDAIQQLLLSDELDEEFQAKVKRSLASIYT